MLWSNEEKKVLYKRDFCIRFFFPHHTETVADRDPQTEVHTEPWLVVIVTPQVASSFRIKMMKSSQQSLRILKHSHLLLFLHFLSPETNRLQRRLPLFHGSFKWGHLPRTGNGLTPRRRRRCRQPSPLTRLPRECFPTFLNMDLRTLSFSLDPNFHLSSSAAEILQILCALPPYPP